MRLFTLIVLGVSLSCCVDRKVLPYTAAETDAINARTQCKQLARNSVEVARCDNR